MTEPTDRLKIREEHKTWLQEQEEEFEKKWKTMNSVLYGPSRPSGPILQQVDPSALYSEEVAQVVREQDELLARDNNVSGFEFYKDEKLEYQHALMKSHLGFARFYHDHQFTHAHLTDVEIYAMWQEKSREK